MRKELNNFNVKELSYKEIRLINGGGPVWRWFGQVVGYISNAVEAVANAWTSTPEGHAAQQALRDFQ
jgi:hypothetical protein